MASSLVFKVYNEGEHIASCMFAEDAAMVVGNTEAGTVKVDGRIVWREGKEERPACDFVDWAASLMHERRASSHARRYARQLEQRGARPFVLDAYNQIQRSQDVAGVLDALATFERNTKSTP